MIGDKAAINFPKFHRATIHVTSKNSPSLFLLGTASKPNRRSFNIKRPKISKDLEKKYLDFSKTIYDTFVKPKEKSKELPIIIKNVKQSLMDNKANIQSNSENISRTCSSNIEKSVLKYKLRKSNSEMNLKTERKNGFSFVKYGMIFEKSLMRTKNIKDFIKSDPFDFKIKPYKINFNQL